MKVQNTRRIAEKLMELMQLKEASSMVNTIITSSIAANSIIPPDPEALGKVEITKPEHIDYYMRPQNIISLIDRTDIIF